MKYMLLIYSAESCWTEDERKECMIESMGIAKELETEGKWLASAPLHSVTTATSVRVRNGKRQITDGPFAETTEQLGGYYIIDVDDIDEAVSIASRLPPAKKGTVELRPIVELPDSLTLPDCSTTEPVDVAEGRVMKYMLLMYAEEGVWPPSEHAPALAECVRLCHELNDKGQYLGAAPLQPSSSAICVRVRSGDRVVVDRPLPETKERLGGYFLIAAADLDEAIAIATKLPGTARGTAEIRPLFPLPESGADENPVDSVQPGSANL